MKPNIMNSKFKITIPKPCHENWNTMTPKEKGRFCSSCSKTVVDFTKKSKIEIQEYLIENKKQKVCGHFYRKQLDAVTIEITQTTFNKQLSFQKLFILSLFLVMGTSLFSCQYSDGKKQKIENIIIIDTLKKVDSIEIKKDLLVIPKTRKTGVSFCDTTSKKESIIDITTTGDVIELTDAIGEIEIVDGMIDLDYEPEEIGFIVIEEPPRFKTSKKLTKENAQKDFDKKIKKFIQENFDKKISLNLDLKKGMYRIFFLIVIDENGDISDIKVRAPYIKLEKEVKRMLKKLPQFIPGKQDGRFVKTKYTLPISFEVE
jgi:hypothetical protein